MSRYVSIVLYLISFAGFSQKKDIFELYYNLPLNASHEEILYAAWENSNLQPEIPEFKGSAKKKERELEAYKKVYFIGKIKDQIFDEIKTDSSGLLITTGERSYKGVVQKSIVISSWHIFRDRDEDATKSYEYIYEYLSKFNTNPIFKEVDYGEGKSKGRNFTYKHFMKDGFYIIEVERLFNNTLGHYISMEYWRPK